MDWTPDSPLNPLAKFVFAGTRFSRVFGSQCSTDTPKVRLIRRANELLEHRSRRYGFGDQRWTLSRIRVRGDAVLISAKIPGSSAKQPSVQAVAVETDKEVRPWLDQIKHRINPGRVDLMRADELNSGGLGVRHIGRAG